MLFAKRTKADTSTLKDNFDALNTALGNEEPGTTAYQTILDQLKTVNEMMTKNPPWSFKPSPDVILTSIVTIGIAVAMIKHEQLNVFTSKVVGLMPKLMK